LPHVFGDLGPDASDDLDAVVFPGGSGYLMRPGRLNYASLTPIRLISLCASALPIISTAGEDAETAYGEPSGEKSSKGSDRFAAVFLVRETNVCVSPSKRAEDEERQRKGFRSLLVSQADT
jgi:hypothetical protein